MNYSQKLLDPRWQRVRLEVLSREDFTCERCQSTTKTLHVHHGYYERGLEPWEYDTDTLRCLCEDCHPEVQATATEIHRLLGSLSMTDLDIALGFLRCVVAENIGGDLVIPLENAEVVEGVALAAGLREGDIHAARDAGTVSVAAISGARTQSRKAGYPHLR